MHLHSQLAAQQLNYNSSVCSSHSLTPHSPHPYMYIYPGQGMELVHALISPFHYPSCWPVDQSLASTLLLYNSLTKHMLLRILMFSVLFTLNHLLQPPPGCLTTSRVPFTWITTILLFPVSCSLHLGGSNWPVFVYLLISILILLL